MILVDTSVWIDHFHKKDNYLKKLLEDGLVYIHHFIIGELACGNLKNRDEILILLQSLPKVRVAQHDEVMYFINYHKIFSKGLGYIDVHLLTSCFLYNKLLYTKDKHLKKVGKEFDIIYEC
ncbi:MAG: type II toxin-antitoxin system VapC family toxin [Candidatus Marinimicrobia bacterium]|nr:type II toxin-antitoxin system VapC family toxin [bacterium]MCG2715552.1 type II toxin-antitoxin system VapC family toxin [Candidatus Neomarinimicrobiota bacterium]